MSKLPTLMQILACFYLLVHFPMLVSLPSQEDGPKLHGPLQTNHYTDEYLDSSIIQQVNWYPESLFVMDQ